MIRGNFEFKIRDGLRLASIEEFLPTFTVKARWSDRVKVLERPLFPGYIFVRLDPELGGLASLVASSRVQVLPSNLNPEIVADTEVETLVKLCGSELPLLAAEYKRGQTVTILNGPLAGVAGVVSKVRNKYRLTVNVEIFHRAVEVELDAAACHSWR